MSEIPSLSYIQIINALQRTGFVVLRQKGSHIFFRHADGRTTTIPKHPGRDLARPLVREIIKEIELTPEEFVKVLRKIV